MVFAVFEYQNLAAVREVVALRRAGVIPAHGDNRGIVILGPLRFQVVFEVE